MLLVEESGEVSTAIFRPFRCMFLSRKKPTVCLVLTQSQSFPELRHSKYDIMQNLVTGVSFLLRNLVKAVAVLKNYPNHLFQESSQVH